MNRPIKARQGELPLRAEARTSSTVRAIRIAAPSLLLVGIVALCPGGPSKREGPFPVRIASVGLPFHEADSARAFLDAPIEPEDERPCFDFPDGHRAPASTPAEVLAALRADASPLTNYDAKFCQHVVRDAVPAEVFLAAEPAVRSAVRAFGFEEGDVAAAIPAVLGPALSCDEMEMATAIDASDQDGFDFGAALQELLLSGPSWPDHGLHAAFPQLRVASRARESVVLTDDRDTEVEVRIVLLGDLAPDEAGEEEMLWVVETRSLEHTYTSLEFAVIRLSDSGRPMVVRRFAW